MADTDKNISMDEQKKVAQKMAEAAAEQPLLVQRHSHHSSGDGSHHHSSGHSHHSHRSDNTKNESKFRRFMRKNRKNFTYACVAVVCCVCVFMVGTLFDANGFNSDNNGGQVPATSNPDTGTAQTPAGGTAPTQNNNAGYTFSKVDGACDSYSNNAGTVKIDHHNNVQAVYGLYDALVQKYPDYVTKTLLGTIEKENLPIYRYDFTPKLPLDSTMSGFCKILYCSGIHGGEVTPIEVGYRFFKDLCENWQSQELLMTLRFNVQFTVIPLVNPYGFVHSTRQNENGVDLNRNFTNGWSNANGYVVGDTHYPGEAPASEISTQLIESMTAKEKFHFILDHHTYDTYTNSGKVGYFVVNGNNTKDASFSNMMSVWMNAKTMVDNPLIDDFSTSHFENKVGKGCGGYVFGAVSNGICFENMFRWGSDAMEKAYPAQKFNAETVGAIFLSAYIGYYSY